MGIKAVTVGVKRLINLGNYENVTYECSVLYEVNEERGEDASTAYQNALDFCKEKVGAELERLKPSKK